MKQGLLHQGVRYGLVGGVVYAVDFASYAAILWAVPGSYLPANVAGKAIGAVTGFILHRNFTFSWDQKAGAAEQALSYSALVAFNIALSSVLLWVLVAHAGFNELWIKPLVDAVVIGSAFIAGRLWIYRPA